MVFKLEGHGLDYVFCKCSSRFYLSLSISVSMLSLCAPRLFSGFLKGFSEGIKVVNLCAEC